MIYLSYFYDFELQGRVGNEQKNPPQQQLRLLQSPQVISRHEIDAFASSIVATLQQFEFMENGRKKLDVFLLGLNNK